MKNIYYLISALFLLATLTACSGSKKSNQSEGVEMNMIKPASQPGPSAILYKTKNDYYDKVPVILNAEKNTIISFPDPKDIKRNGNLTYPEQLLDGFLLDKRGINENAAFLNITYTDYSKLPKAPSADELKAMILDDDPLVEMYNCGLMSNYKDAVKELNQKIKDNALEEFKELK